MMVYLAGVSTMHRYLSDLTELESRICVLESFCTIRPWVIPYIDTKWDFILDSGAFTFMSTAKDLSSIDWESYIDKYADFIIESNVGKFIELDIDSVVGFNNVLKLRNRLESRVGRQSIPVWHKSRGMDNWKQTSKDYSYVSIGGIVTKEIKRGEYKAFNPMIDIAHINGAKVHGLGFTPANGDLKYYRFDSTDSTSWISGNKFGHVNKFNGNRIENYERPIHKKSSYKKLICNNFTEWVKFQRYMKGF